MASHNQPVDYVKRHQSRLKREMYANRLNPFNSPPSSTGSHGTVSTTTAELTQDLSNFSFNPEDEGTRKLSDDNQNSLPKRLAAGRTAGRFGTRPTTTHNLDNINTSALGRTFPEWGLAASTRDLSINPSARPATKSAVKFAAQPASNNYDDETKENIPPPADDSLPLKYLTTRRTRTRAEMQPRVDPASDCSTVLSQTPTQPLQPSRRSRFAKAAQPQSPGSPVQDSRPSIQNIVSKLRSTQSQQEKEFEEKSLNNRSALTGRSFLLPPFHHLFDLTSGTLKFSTLKNGIPVFVRHGRTRTQFEQPTNQHDTVDAVDIPEEDQEIFVSMDKIREEVQELQEHDHMVQREAEKLQLEVNRLQGELKRFKQRKHSDSAFGSGSESEQSINRALDAQRNRKYPSTSSLIAVTNFLTVYDEKIAQLQSRLEQAGRQVGVNDIHSSALTAERDEALHQASQARERAKKVQAQLESSQNFLESTARDKEMLETQNASFRASNDRLREQNASLRTEQELKTAELNGIRQELASLNNEMQRLRESYESLREERAMLAEDHASMEHQNESYYKENKSLRSKIESGDRRISDLEKGISRRDQLINELQANMTKTQMTEPAGIREYDELASKVQRLTEQHSAEHQKKDALVQARDDKIRSLTDHLLRIQEQLSDSLVQQREIMHLKDELNELRQHEAMWQRDRTKNGRMTRIEGRLSKDLQHHQKLEAQWAEEKFLLQRRIEQLSGALRTVRQATKNADLTQTNNVNTTEQPAKATPLNDPSLTAKQVASEQSAKSEAVNVDDDLTRQIDMTEESDFLSVLTGDPVVELKDVTDQLQLRKQNPDQDGEDTSAGNTVQTGDSDLPSLPGPVHRRSKSDNVLTFNQKPVGILKKSTKFAQDDNTTGVFSVQSRQSAVSIRSQRSYSSASENMTSAFIIPDLTIQKGADITSEQQGAAQHGKEVATDNTAQNKNRSASKERTAELFRKFENVSQTLRSTSQEHVRKAAETDKRVQNRHRSLSEERRTALLSKEAAFVLDSMCRHKTTNCTVCARMTRPTVRHQSSRRVSAVEGITLKKHVRIQRPVPVSERVQQSAEDYTEEHTMRPSMPPGNALAIVIKELEDEARHLELQMEATMSEIFKLPKATDQRKRKLLTIKHHDLQREYESKSAQLYKLHDVLEGQKQAGQLMTLEEMDVTIASIRGVEVTEMETQTRARAQDDPEWKPPVWDSLYGQKVDWAAFD